MQYISMNILVIHIAIDTYRPLLTPRTRTLIYNLWFLVRPILTHLLRRTLIPIIVTIQNQRLISSRTVTMMVGLVFLVPGVAEIAQSPVARRPLHAHASLLLGAVEFIGGFRILEFPFRRHDELADAVRWCFFLVPVVCAANALPLRFVLVLFHIEDGVDEVSVGGFGLVPALQAQVALFQPFDMHFDSLRVHCIDSPIVTVVAFDN